MATTTTTITTTTTGPITCDTRTDLTVDQPVIEGILIAGGDGSGTTMSAEIFIPSTGQTCSFPGLPDKRSYHTLDTVDGKPTLCGGCCSPSIWSNWKGTSCLQFSPLSSTGTWV